MVVTQFDLKLANYVQDKGHIDFEACEILFDKSTSTLKRSIYTLNEYIPDPLNFSISHHEIKTNMTYADFAELCQRLTLDDYSASVEERIMLVISFCLINGIVNMTELYSHLNLSLSTKKKDRKELGHMMDENGIRVINRHRKGISLTGNERFLRMFVARHLLSVIELDRNDDYIPRQANSPVQTLLYDMFEQFLSVYHKEVTEKLDRFFGSSAEPVDYPSKKFIYLHMMISLIRISKGYPIGEGMDDMPEVEQNDLLSVVEDSNYLDLLIASLNYKKPLKFPENGELKKRTEEFIRYIEQQNQMVFHTYDELFDELYAYLYKCSIKNKLDYYFYDDKLDDTKYVFPDIYKSVKTKAEEWKNAESLMFTDHQISVLCLIIERFLVKNRIAGINNRKIVIITNSSVEKVNFFLEILSQHVSFEMVSYLTINELYKLEDMSFDSILTFSNRITVLLSELGWTSIKLNFYITSDDIKLLLDKGFISSRNKKLIAEDIIKELNKEPSPEKKISYLTENFPDIMI